MWGCAGVRAGVRTRVRACVRGREGGGGRERRDECYTYSNGPPYLNSSYVTYYVITYQLAFVVWCENTGLCDAPSAARAVV